MTTTLIGERLESAGASRGELQVSLSREQVSLLSEQLYTSPLKAIEELVETLSLPREVELRLPQIGRKTRRRQTKQVPNERIRAPRTGK